MECLSTPVEMIVSGSVFLVPSFPDYEAVVGDENNDEG